MLIDPFHHRKTEVGHIEAARGTARSGERTSTPFYRRPALPRLCEAANRAEAPIGTTGRARRQRDMRDRRPCGRLRHLSLTIRQQRTGHSRCRRACRGTAEPHDVGRDRRLRQCHRPSDRRRSARPEAWRQPVQMLRSRATPRPDTSALPVCAQSSAKKVQLRGRSLVPPFSEMAGAALIGVSFGATGFAHCRPHPVMRLGCAPEHAKGVIGACVRAICRDPEHISGIYAEPPSPRPEQLTGNPIAARTRRGHRRSDTPERKVLPLHAGWRDGRPCASLNGKIPTLKLCAIWWALASALAARSGGRCSFVATVNSASHRSKCSGSTGSLSCTG
jgi:hypothetical protein